MYVLLHFFDDSILFLLFLTWIITGSLVFLLPKRISSKRRRLEIRRCFVWLGLAELLVVIKLGTLVSKWVFFGWIFAQGRMLLDIPLLALPALSVLFFSFPSLRSMAQSLPRDGESPAKQDTTATALRIPTLITVVGVALDTYLTFIYTDPGYLPLLLIVFALFCLLLWFWLTRREKTSAMPVNSSRRRGLIRTIPVLATALLVPPAWYLWSMQASRLPDRIPMMGNMPAENLVTYALDRPLYYSVHSASAHLAPEGSALVHLMKYLRPGEAAEPQESRQELEALMDLLQPGWRAEVVEQSFLPHMIATNAIVQAKLGGLSGRPGPEVPDLPNLYVAGDWVGPEGEKADTCFASARSAARLMMAQLNDRQSTSLASSSDVTD